jgi:hypothetical protein
MFFCDLARSDHIKRLLICIVMCLETFASSDKLQFSKISLLLIQINLSEIFIFASIEFHIKNIGTFVYSY